jgi:hypothetical protein
MATENEITFLSSHWKGLSKHLIAVFYPLKRLPDGSGWEQSSGTRELNAKDKYIVDDGFEVRAPISDGNQEMTLNWNSPFEGTGAEAKAPALTAMLQSGTLNGTLTAAAQWIGRQFGAGDVDAAAATGLLGRATGRTGITKLNSTQIFSGMPPIKLTMTLHFRALEDPVKEVRKPIMQLKQWALPQLLSADGLISGVIKGNEDGYIEKIFPSISPQIIGMRYGDMTYEPMVIESISEPFTLPRSKDGVIVAQSIQITLATLTALDRRDLEKIYIR